MTEQTPAPDAPEPSWVPEVPAAPPATEAVAAERVAPEPVAPEPAASRASTKAWLIPVVAAAALIVGLFGGFAAAHAFSSDAQRDSHVGFAGPGGAPGFGDGQGGQQWHDDGNQGLPPGVGPEEGDGDGQFPPPGPNQPNPTLPQPSTSSAPLPSS
jgi:hypothetical protein